MFWRFVCGALVFLLVLWFYFQETPIVKKVETRKFKSVGEELCTRIMEEYFKREVQVNLRPKFLTNPETKRCLELDVYDPQTKTAIEYNGIQHYVYPNRFHKTRKEFEQQKKRDLLKERLCREEGVRLIIVPYTVDSFLGDHDLRYHALKDFIFAQLKDERKLLSTT